MAAPFAHLAHVPRPQSKIYDVSLQDLLSRKLRGSHLDAETVVSVISHCTSRTLAENSVRYDVILYVTMF